MVKLDRASWIAAIVHEEIGNASIIEKIFDMPSDISAAEEREEHALRAMGQSAFNHTMFILHNYDIGASVPKLEVLAQQDGLTLTIPGGKTGLSGQLASSPYGVALLPVDLPKMVVKLVKLGKLGPQALSDVRPLFRDTPKYILDELAKFDGTWDTEFTLASPGTQVEVGQVETAAGLTFGGIIGAIRGPGSPRLAGLPATLWVSDDPVDPSPIDLGYADQTSYGLTADSNISSGGYTPYTRSQMSPEWTRNGLVNVLVDGIPTMRGDVLAAATNYFDPGNQLTYQTDISQLGLVALAAGRPLPSPADALGRGLTANEILEHYFHANPPTVRAIEVTAVDSTDLVRLQELADTNQQTLLLDLLFGKYLTSRVNLNVGSLLESVANLLTWRVGLRSSAVYVRKQVDKTSPESARRELRLTVPVLRGGVRATEPIGIALFFSEYLSEMDLFDPTDDPSLYPPALAGLVKFKYDGQVHSLDELGGRIYVFGNTKTHKNGNHSLLDLSRGESYPKEYIRHNSAETDTPANLNKGAILLFIVLDQPHSLSGKHVVLSVGGSLEADPTVRLDADPTTVAMANPDGGWFQYEPGNYEGSYFDVAEDPPRFKVSSVSVGTTNSPYVERCRLDYSYDAVSHVYVRNLEPSGLAQRNIGGPRVVVKGVLESGPPSPVIQVTCDDIDTTSLNVISSMAATTFETGFSSTALVDGVHRLHVIAKSGTIEIDADPVTPEFDLGGDSSLSFVVQNFPPHVGRVEARHGGRLVSYGAWATVFVDGKPALQWTDSLNGERAAPMTSLGAVDLEVTFSEPVNDASVSLRAANGHELPVTLSPPPGVEKPTDYWVGRFTVTDQYTGKNTFSITATDTGNAPLDSYVFGSSPKGPIFLTDLPYFDPDTGLCMFGGVKRIPGPDTQHTLDVELGNDNSPQAICEPHDPDNPLSPPAGSRFGGDWNLSLDLPSAPDLDYALTLTPEQLAGRIRGYVPWDVIIPDISGGMGDIFGTLFSGRGIPLKFCSAKTDGTQQEQENDLLDKFNAAKARRLAQGLPADKVRLFRTKVAAFGEQATSLNALITDPAHLDAAAAVGSVIYNNSVLASSEFSELMKDGEQLMVLFQDLSLSYSVIDATLSGVAAATGDASTALEMAKNAATYLLENSFDLLKCEAYKHKDELIGKAASVFKKLPQGDKYKGWLTQAVQTVQNCPGLQPPADCTVFDELTHTYYETLDTIDKLQNIKLPSHLVDVSAIASDVSQEGAGLTQSVESKLIHQAQVQLDLAVPYVSQITSAATYLIALLDTGDGNFSASLSDQLGDASGLLARYRADGKPFRTRVITAAESIPELAGALGSLPEDLPIIGPVAQAFKGFGLKSNASNAGEQIMEMIDPPPVLTVTHPCAGNVIGFSTDQGVLFVEGHVSDFLPHLVKVSAQVDDGPAVSTGLDLTTISTDPDGSTGNAFFRLKVLLNDGGVHLLKVTAANAAGHEVSQTFQVYLDGTHFPRQDLVVGGITSFAWKAKSFFGTVKAEGLGRLSYIGTSAGNAPVQEFQAAASAAGASFSAEYPDHTPDPDIEFAATADGPVIGTMPADGHFFARLKTHYEGATFVTVVGNADSLGFARYLLEFKNEDGPDQPGAGDFTDVGHQILAGTSPVVGPIERIMGDWRVSPQRLTGRYTIRTRLRDTHLPTFAPLSPFPLTKGPFASGAVLQSHLAAFSGDEEVDRATFSLGTPLDAPPGAGTIVTDPYGKFELLVQGGTLNETDPTVYANVFPIPDGPVRPVGGGLAPIGSVWEIYPKLTPDDFADGQTARLTVHYTLADLKELLPIFGSPGDEAHRLQILEENLGLYREITDSTLDLGEEANTVSGVLAEGERAYVQTKIPLGTFTAFAETADLASRYLLLTSNSAPLLNPPPFASPFIFSPEGTGRKLANVFFNVRTGCSPVVYVNAEVYDRNTGRFVATIADGIGQLKPTVLAYIGDAADPIQDSLIDPATGSAEATGEQKNYYFKTAVAASVSWDGIGQREDASVGLVSDGVYTVRLKVMDAAGNISTAETLVIKGNVPPVIKSVGAHAAPGPVTLNVQADGSSVPIMGTAINPAGFNGYRLGLRPRLETVTTYLDVPKAPLQYFMDDPKVSAIQITDDLLGNLPLAGLKNGDYVLGVYLLGQDGNPVDVATVDLTVANPSGLYDLIASPSPFSQKTELSAAHADAANVDFYVLTGPGVPPAGLVLHGVIDPPPSVRWRATLDPATLGSPPGGPYVVEAVALAGGTQVSTTYSVNPVYVNDLNLLGAVIASPASPGDVTGTVQIVGTANAASPEIFQSYRLTYHTDSDPGTEIEIRASSRPVNADVLGSLDVSVINAGQITVTLAVTGVSGQVKTTSAIWNLPFAVSVAASPTSVAMDSKIAGTVGIAYGANKPTTALTLTVHDAADQVVRTLVDVPAAAPGSFTADWDLRNDAGAQVPSGNYTVVLVSTLGLETRAASAPVHVGFVGIPAVTASLGPIDGVPKPYFDLLVSGLGTYEVPLVARPKLTKKGTEKWVNHPMVLRSAYDDLHNRFNCAEASASDVTTDICTGNSDQGTFQSTFFWIPFVSSFHFQVSSDCPGCNGGNAAVGSVGADEIALCHDGNCESFPRIENPGCNTAAGVLDRSAAAGSFFGYQAFGIGSGGTGKAHGQTSFYSSCFTPFQTQLSPITSSANLTDFVVYPHRSVSRPFILPFTPSAANAIYYSLAPAGPKNEPRIATVYDTENPPSVTNSDPVATYDFSGFSSVYSGLNRATRHNQYSDLLVSEDGATEHPWGSVDMALQGTVTVGLKTPIGASDFAWKVRAAVLRKRKLVAFTEDTPNTPEVPADGLFHCTALLTTLAVDAAQPVQEWSFVPLQDTDLEWNGGGDGTLSIRHGGIEERGWKGSLHLTANTRCDIRLARTGDLGTANASFQVGEDELNPGPLTNAVTGDVNFSTLEHFGGSSRNLLLFTVNGLRENLVPIPFIVTIQGTGTFHLQGQAETGQSVDILRTSSFNEYLPLPVGVYRLTTSALVDGSSVEGTTSVDTVRGGLRRELVLGADGTQSVTLDPDLPSVLLHWERQGADLTIDGPGGFHLAAAGATDPQSGDFFSVQGGTYTLTLANATLGSSGKLVYGALPAFLIQDEIVTASGKSDVGPSGSVNVNFTLQPSSPMGPEDTIQLLEPAAPEDYDSSPFVKTELGGPVTGTGVLTGVLHATGQLALTRPWSLPATRLADGVLKFGKLNKFNVFERLVQSGAGLPRAFPAETATVFQAEGPDKTPHTSQWQVSPAVYPGSNVPDPDVEVVASDPHFGDTQQPYTSPVSSSLGVTDGALGYDAGFGTGEVFGDYGADQLVARLRPPSEVPYAARTFVRIPGVADFFRPAHYRLEFKPGEADSGEPLTTILDTSTPPSGGVLGYWDVTDLAPGRYTVVTTFTDDRQQNSVFARTVDLGHPISALSGGAASDAYEQVFLQFPPGALKTGHDRWITIRQRRIEDVPLLQNNFLPAGLIFTFRAGAGTEETGLSKDDFVQDANQNVLLSANLTLHYDDHQIPSNINEGQMNLYRIDDGGGSLTLVPAYLDKENNVIIAEVTQFSTYEVIADDSPPRIDVQATPSPASVGTVRIFFAANRTLSETPHAWTTPLTPGGFKSELSGLRNVGIPYLNGTVGEVGNVGVINVSHPDRVTLYAPIPADVQDDQWPGRVITIGGQGFVVDEVVRDTASAPTRFQVILKTPAGEAIPDVRARGVIVGQPWSVNVNGVPLSGAVVGIGDLDAAKTKSITLRTFAPGEMIGYPPAPVLTGLRVLIGTATFYVDAAVIEGSAITGGRVLASLKDGSGLAVGDPFAAGVREGLPWQIDRRSNVYEADYVVTSSHPTGSVFVETEGTDLTGHAGRGTGVFYVGPNLPAVLVEAHPDHVRPGQPVQIIARRTRPIPDFGINVYFPGDLTPHAVPLTPAVVPGTHEVADVFSGTIFVPAGAPDGAGSIYAVLSPLSALSAGQFTVDGSPPTLAIQTPAAVVGAGGVALRVVSNELLQGAELVFVDAAGQTIPVTLQASGLIQGSAANQFDGVLTVAAGVARSGEGTLRAVGTDLAGNQATVSVPLTLDLESPAAATNLVATPLSHSEFQLRWTLPTDEAPSRQLVYQDGIPIQDVPWAGAGNQVTVVGELTYGGLYRFEVVTVDAHGNRSLPARLDAWLDLDGPTSTLTLGDPHVSSLDTQDPTVFVSPATSLTLTATDTGSGLVDRIEYRQDAGVTFQTYTHSVSGSLLDAHAAFEYRAVDVAGNVESTRSTRLFVDDRPPRLSLVALFPSYAGVGQSSTQAVPSDTAAMTDAAFIATLTATGLSIPIAGISSDVIQAARNGLFVTADHTGTAGVYIGPTTPITYAGNDGEPNGAGISSVHMRLDDEPPLAVGPPPSNIQPGISHPEGTYRLVLYGCDRVGNCTNEVGVGAGLSMKLIIDKTKPFSAIHCLTGDQAMLQPGTQIVLPGEIYASLATSFALSATDLGAQPAGVGRIEYRLDQDVAYRVDPSPGTAIDLTMVGPATVHFAEGDHVLDFRSVDRVENVETFQHLVVHADGTAPSTTLMVGSPRFGATPPSVSGSLESYAGQQPMFVNTGTNLRFSATDTNSGLLRTEYRFDATAPFVTDIGTLTGDSAPVRNAPFTFEFRSVDRVQNIESVRTATIYVDTVAPATALILAGPVVQEPGTSTIVGPITTLAFTATDAGSGVQPGTISYRITGPGLPAGQTAGFTVPFALGPLAEGLYLVEHRAQDRVTNLREFGTPFADTLAYDVTPPLPPTVIFTPPAESVGGVPAITEETAVTFVTEDPGQVQAGVARYEWRLDDEPNYHVVAPGVPSFLRQYAFGQHVIHVRAVDRVENVGEEGSSGTFVLTSREWPRWMFSNARSGHPELSGMRPPYAEDWRADFPFFDGARGMLVAHDRVYAFLNGPFPPSNGKATGNKNPPPAGNPFTIVALPVGGSTTIWSVAAGDSMTGFSYENERLVVGSAGRVQCLDAATGAVLWTQTAPGMIAAGPPMAAGQRAVLPASGELAYFAASLSPASRGHAVVAVEMTTGKIRWTRTLPANVVSWHLSWGGAPAVRDGKVLVSLQDRLLALDALTGATLWQQGAYRPSRPPAIGSDVVVAPAVSGTLHGIVALEFATGALRWFKPVDVQNGQTDFFAAAVDGADRVYYDEVGHPFPLRVRDGATGALAWSSAIVPSSEAVVVNGIVYVETAAGITALRQVSPGATTAEVLWTGAPGVFGGTPILAKNRLFAQRVSTSGPLLTRISAHSSNEAGLLSLRLPTTVEAGVPFSMTLTALDALGRPATGYLGTATYTSTDPWASLPSPQTFVAANAGVRVSGGNLLLRAGGTNLLISDGVLQPFGVGVNVLPHAPISLTAEGGAGKVVLNWSYPDLRYDAITGYSVFRATASAGPFADVGLTEGRGATLFTVSGLEDGRQYYFQIVALDASGFASRPSAVVSAVPYAGPTPPTFLVATGTEGGVRVEWTPSQATINAVTGYDVYRRTGTSPFMPVMRLVGAGVSVFVDDALVEGRSYDYLVRGRDTTGRRSDPSNADDAVATPDHAWRQLQREPGHRAFAAGEVLNSPLQRKWGTTAGSYLGTVVKDGRVFTLDDTSVTADDLGSGTRLWRYVYTRSLPLPATPCLAAADGAVYLTDGKSVIALDAAGNPANQTTTVRWQTALTAGSTGTNPASPQAVPRIGLTAASGMIYLGLRGQAFALDSGGKIRWQATLANAPLTARIFPPVVSGDSVAFLTEQGRLTVFATSEFDVATRTAALRYQADLAVTGLTGAPTVGEDGVLLVPATNLLLAFNVNDGSPLWSFSVTGATFPVEAAVAGGTAFIVSGTDGTLRALNVATGAQLWAFSPAAAANLSSARSFSAPALSADHVYYTLLSRSNAKGAETGHLVSVALPQAGGQPVLEQMTSEDLGLTTQSPAVAYRTVVIGRTAYDGPEAVRLELSVPASVVSGESFALAIRALKADGTPDPGFSGTIRLTSSDPNALIGSSVTIGGGGGTFGVTLFKTGNVSISGVVVDRPGIAGSVSLNVKPTTGSVDHFVLSAPTQAFPGTGFTMTATAEDRFGNVVSGFTGTVEFTSTDPLAQLPPPTAFTKADAGVHLISATLFTVGQEIMTVRNVGGVNGASGQVPVQVVLGHEFLVFPGDLQYWDMDFFGADVGWVVGRPSSGEGVPLARALANGTWNKATFAQGQDCTDLTGVGVSLSSTASGSLVIYPSVCSNGGGGYQSTLSGTTWSDPESAPDNSTPMFHSIFMVSPSEGWQAVSTSMLYHFDGQSWSPFQSAGQGVTVFRIGFVKGQADEGWAATDRDMMHFVNGMWIHDTTGPAGAFGLWMNGPQDVWAGGIFGLWHYDSSGWQKIQLAPELDATIIGLHFFDPNHGIAVCQWFNSPPPGISADTPIVLSYRDGIWSKVDFKNPEGLRSFSMSGVRMTSQSEAWAIGSGAPIVDGPDVPVICHLRIPENAPSVALGRPVGGQRARTPGDIHAGVIASTLRPPSQWPSAGMTGSLRQKLQW